MTSRYEFSSKAGPVNEQYPFARAKGMTKKIGLEPAENLKAARKLHVAL